MAEDIKLVGGPKMREKLDLLLSSKEIILTLGLMDLIPSPLRRLCSFADKEVKIRTIAILDYFSQSSLRPLHSYIYRILRKIRQDVTFKQSSFKDLILTEEVQSNGSLFHSIDLSSATDRFPIRLEAEVLRGVLPSWYVSA